MKPELYKYYQYAFILLASFIALNAAAQTMPDKQSTTGPVPPATVLEKEMMKMAMPQKDGVAQIIPGVPAYAWRHGCGPTALGMVVGYYDTLGFDDLFNGDAGMQTWDVLKGIASQGSGVRGEGEQQHYEDYSLPMDDGAPAVLPDSSETYPSGCHAGNSIADFMHTSWSADDNFYGWSWSNKIIPAFTSYVNLRNPDYIGSVSQYWMGNGTLTWSILTEEINLNRPMVFLVDTEGDGDTDHFVTVIGFTEGPPRQYGCLDTWHPIAAVRWCDFNKMAEGVPWGVFCGWTFDLEKPAEGEGEPCIENPEQCPQPQGGTYVEGDELCLCVPCPVDEASTFSWMKNGTPLSNGGRVFGALTRTLQIVLLDTDDSGRYTCAYEDGSKTVTIFEAQVAVVKKVPATDYLGIAFASGICGLAGMYMLIKRGTPGLKRHTSAH